MKFALLVEYDGAGFSGWQVQPGARTVQGELQTAFGRLVGTLPTVIGAGRTDAGVHALGMVAHVDLTPREDVPAWKMLEAVNSLTGQDIVVRDIRSVSDDFHARYTALERTYLYTIARRRVAIGRGTVWQVPQPLHVGAMAEAIALLRGEHDFTSFSKLSNDVGHYRCTVTEAVIEEEGERLAIHLCANRFVRGMVRAVVGALVEVGRGRLASSEFADLVNAPRELHRAKFICPPEGLTFMNVRYPDQFGLW